MELDAPAHSDLDSIFLEAEDEAPLPRKKVPSGDLYEAARAGDVDRLRFWLEQGVNVNARDSWDSVALYYACLAGHLDAALVLLENGSICSEHTFDGDRCHYAALNLRVRKLLKAFESRPPPLDPLARDVRQLFVSTGPNGSYVDGSSGIKPATVSVATAPDMLFFVAGTPIGVHRAILAARSPFFRQKFANEWKDRHEIRFAGRKLKFSALLSLIHFFYSDRLDVAVEDMEDLVRICKVCRCWSLQLQLEKELLHQKYADYKSVNGVDESQRRYILQGSALPEQDRLSACLRNLFMLSRDNSSMDELTNLQYRMDHDDPGETCRPRNCQMQNSAGNEQGPAVGDVGADSPELLWNDEQAQSGGCEVNRLQAVEGPVTSFAEDHADVCFLADGKLFRSHRFILAARSEYFAARFSRADDFQDGSRCLFGGFKGVMQVLEEHDMDASTFQMLLEYVYTGALENVDCDQAEKMFDAASRYLMFSLKRAVADALLPQLESATPAELCNWLLLADMYGVWKLREHCLDVMALNFEVFALTLEFRQMVASLPAPSGDSSLRTTAPNAPGEGGQDKQDNILDDLREKWLAIEGEELDKRDSSAVEFDRMLEELVMLSGVDG